MCKIAVPGCLVNSLRGLTDIVSGADKPTGERWEEILPRCGQV